MQIQWGDIATWTASIAALIFGVLGFRRAGKANQTAADALIAAKRQAASAEKANQTADEALAVARRATKAAEESAAEAKRTADLAELSNARSGERNDVVWIVEDGSEGGIWRATNTGADPGYKARLMLKGDGVDIHTDPQDISHGMSIEVDLKERWAAANVAAVRMREEFSAKAIFYMPSPTLRLTYRILWETRTGAECVWTTEDAKRKALEAKK
ncbi:hypothetical protein [Arthrobacter sp. MA-N2]|uniref:hypothetical protein n=1 Tax=Arthrobacter sp. MA-N2 TaxID=1101188 RepID=UPI000485540D|nr:hypothetical protein [Arthrobacter sp. MA-N2]